MQHETRPLVLEGQEQHLPSHKEAHFTTTAMTTTMEEEERLKQGGEEAHLEEAQNARKTAETRDFEPEGTIDKTSANVSESSNSSPLSSYSSANKSDSSPSHLRWSESIEALLEDSEGCSLFADFLQEQNMHHYITFWALCNGLKDPTQERARIEKGIEFAFKKFIKAGNHSNKLLECLSQPLRLSLTRRIEQTSRETWPASIFDEAQREVVAFLGSTAFFKFFECDIYLDYVNSLDGDQAQPEEAKPSLTTTSFATRTTLVAPPSTTVPAKSTLGNQTAQRSVEENPIPKPSSLRPLAETSTFSSSSSALPLTTSSLRRTQGLRSHPQDQQTPSSKVLYADNCPPVPKADEIPRPYDVKGSVFNPTSRNDSELQSQSSGAAGHTGEPTTDEYSELPSRNYSAHSLGARFRSSSSRGQASRPRQQQQQVSVQHHQQQQQQQRETSLRHVTRPQPGGGHNNEGGLQMTTLAEREPEKFAERIIRRLKALLDERQERQPDALHKLDEESDQDIMDKHCRKAFNEHITPRGRSPPRGSRGPQLNSSGSNRHRTLNRGQQVFGVFGPTTTTTSMMPPAAVGPGSSLPSHPDQSWIEGSRSFSDVDLPLNTTSISALSGHCNPRRMLHPSGVNRPRTSHMNASMASDVSGWSGHQHSMLSSSSITSQPLRRRAQSQDRLGPTSHGWPDSSSSAASFYSSNSSQLMRPQATSIVYLFPQLSSSVGTFESKPTSTYMIRTHAWPVTLGVVRTKNPKQGRFRYFFMTRQPQGQTMWVEEEVEESNDHFEAPMCDGKVVVECKIEL